MRAGDVGGVVGGEKADGMGHVGGGAETAGGTADTRVFAFRAGNGELMLSDSAFGPDVHYAGFTLVLDPRDVAEGQRWFEALAVGGRIEMAWQETFWAHGFGKVVDRFGVPWMINVVKQG